MERIEWRCRGDRQQETESTIFRHQPAAAPKQPVGMSSKRGKANTCQRRRRRRSNQLSVISCRSSRLCLFGSNQSGGKTSSIGCTSNQRDRAIRLTLVILLQIAANFVQNVQPNSTPQELDVSRGRHEHSSPRLFSARVVLSSEPVNLADGTPARPITTTTPTTNAMSPLEAEVPTVGGSLATATTTTTIIIGSNSTSARPDNDSLVNTIVVTNGATEAPRQRIQVGMGQRHCNTSEQCNNGALCHLGICFCLPGFTGTTCATNIDECRQFGAAEQQACLNGGLCVDEINAFRCECAPGFRGDRCQFEVDLCAGAGERGPCANGAVCENHRTAFTCHCAAGWTGPTCELNIDDCAPPGLCLNGGQCRDLVAGHQCHCLPGWTGANCAINVDECAQNKCTPNSTQTCIDLTNDYLCECKPGFRGKDCQFEVDECSPRPCANGSQCLDLINGYKCLCAAGWTGDHCELDVNECELAKPVCLNGATCENLSPSYRCHCASGWTGRNCLDVSDFCLAKRPCQNGGLCVGLNSGSNFRCECPSSHLGARCEIRRSCSNECSAEHGHCVANTTTCACQPTVASAGRQPADGPKRLQCEQLTSCNHHHQTSGNSLCLNGGSCLSLPNNTGYQCECAPHFHGPICQFEGAASGQLDLLLLIAIGCVCFLLAACALVSVLMLRSVRRARATRGTYSPSTQEKFESNSAAACGGSQLSATIGSGGATPDKLLKAPAPERLI